MPAGNAVTTILLRKLPRSTSPEALRTMLLFAKGLKEVDFVQNEFEEDQGFAPLLLASKPQLLLQKHKPCSMANQIQQAKPT